VSDTDRPRDTGSAQLASQAPLARGAVLVSLSGAVFGFVFLPQLLGLALAGLSLARREPEGRRPAILAAALAVGFTVAWAVVLGLLFTWWATSR
jgi:MFS family permease